MKRRRRKMLSVKSWSDVLVSWPKPMTGDVHRCFISTIYRAQVEDESARVGTEIFSVDCRLVLTSSTPLYTPVLNRLRDPKTVKLVCQ